MTNTQTETIVLGGGCFWCTEAVFKMIRGVVSVTAGYAGGSTPHPTDTQVYSGTTGHAEVIRLEYDPHVISLDDLLSVFFSSHDPTSLNRQGHDVGEEYRSAIFYTTEQQKAAAERFIAELNASTEAGKPIVTEVKPLNAFYPAADYHQNYFQQNPNAPYCQIVINPKLEKAKKQFATLLAEQSDT